MKRALSVKEVLSMKKDTFPFEGQWADAFGQPERTGVWFVWGNSGNGKSSFVMQLCKELCRFGRVAYDSLEEGACLTMQNTMRRFRMQDVNRRFLLLDSEPLDQLSLRMDRRKSPDFYVIDSFQYTQMTYARKFSEIIEEYTMKGLFPGFQHPGIGDEAVMVGDTQYDLEGAREAGTAFLGAAYGYGAPGELSGEGSLGAAASPDGLRSYLFL